MTHFDLYTVIDMPLWDKANWVATVFLSDRKGEKLPCLGLAFRDRDAATRIFSAWRKRFGDVDTYEEIRVAIIEGDLPNETPGYTVHVSPNVEGMRARAKAEGTNVEENDFFVVVHRFNRMNPASGSPYLPTFKKDYAKFGRYYLIPAWMPGDPSSVEPLLDLAIGKQKVIFRDSADIKKGDPDGVVFKGEAPPEITH